MTVHTRDLVERFHNLMTEFDILKRDFERHLEESKPEPKSRVPRDTRLVMDRSCLTVLWKDQPIEQLTLREFNILDYIASRPDVVRTREQLLDLGWGDNLEVTDRSVDTMVKRIRRKFRDVDPSFNAIRTLYSLGYVWRLPPSTPKA